MDVSGVWLGIILGSGLGGLYVLASFYSNKRALRDPERFLIIVVSMMMLRILVALVAIIVILVLLPVSDSAFLGSFFLIFLVGLVIELRLLHQREADVTRERE